MKISDYLKADQICTELKSTERDEVIKELADLLKDCREIKDFDNFLKDVFERESLQTTGVGDAVAIPHARTPAVENFIIAFGRTKKGIDFKSIDNKPAQLIFLMGTPSENINGYLKILAHLTRLLKKESFRKSLLEAKNQEEIIRIFKEEEK